MGCGSCGSKGGSPNGCKSNGNCGTGGCNALNTYNWLQDMEMPGGYQPFNIVEIRFKGSRKEYYRNEDNLELITGDAVVVESELGHDVGHVSLSGELVKLQLKKNNIDEGDKAIRKIYRVATENDLNKYNEVKAKESNSLEVARTIAMKLGLSMKLSDIEYQGDGRKVIFFYTAEGRVDFRELIKRYASEFKTRIEMRQISYREEASRLGGIGSCGRELCCSTWLTDFKMVTINAVKTQNLAINMLKLSGQCGRLKCCLNYELDTYVEALNDFPKNFEGLVIETKVGAARLMKYDILKKMMWFAYPKKSEWIPVSTDRVNAMVQMNAKGQKPETIAEIRSSAEEDKQTFNFGNEDLISDISITRLDEKKAQEKKKKGYKNKRTKGKGPRKPHTGNPKMKGNTNRGEKDKEGNKENKGKSRNYKKNPNNKRRPPRKPRPPKEE